MNDGVEVETEVDVGEEERMVKGIVSHTHTYYTHYFPASIPKNQEQRRALSHQDPEMLSLLHRYTNKNIYSEQKLKKKS